MPSTCVGLCAFDGSAAVVSPATADPVFGVAATLPFVPLVDPPDVPVVGNPTTGMALELLLDGVLLLAVLLVEFVLLGVELDVVEFVLLPEFVPLELAELLLGDEELVELELDGVLLELNEFALVVLLLVELGVLLLLVELGLLLLLLELLLEPGVLELLVELGLLLLVELLLEPGALELLVELGLLLLLVELATPELLLELLVVELFDAGELLVHEQLALLEVESALAGLFDDESVVLLDLVV